MHSIACYLLERWHQMLDLPRESPSTWHHDRLLEEREELCEAKTRWEKLSETSDVFFCVSRAKHDGFLIEELPELTASNIPVYAYMIAKFTSRWAFYRTLGVICNGGKISEVVNPTKDHKLEAIANRHGIDPAKFVKIGIRLRKVWPLFY